MKTLALGFLSLAIFTGCSRGPALYPASGELTVTLGDLAIQGKKMCTLNEVIPCARVEFIPVDSDSDAMPARGMTDFRGRFTLETPSHGLGAMAGDYRVVVTVNKHYHKRPIPDGYDQLETTPLQITIPKGGDDQVQVHLLRTAK